MSVSNSDADRRQHASATNAQLASDAIGRKLQAAGAMSDIASRRGESERADIATQSTLGQQLRGVDQATRLAPLTLLAQRQDMLSGLPLQLFNGQNTQSSGTSSSTTTEKPSVLDMVGQAVNIASGVKGLFP